MHSPPACQARPTHIPITCTENSGSLAISVSARVCVWRMGRVEGVGTSHHRLTGIILDACHIYTYISYHYKCLCLTCCSNHSRVRPHCRNTCLYKHHLLHCATVTTPKSDYTAGTLVFTIPPGTLCYSNHSQVRLHCTNTRTTPKSDHTAGTLVFTNTTCYTVLQ